MRSLIAHAAERGVSRIPMFKAHILVIVSFWMWVSDVHADPPSSILQAVKLTTSSETLTGFATYSTVDVMMLAQKKWQEQPLREYVAPPPGKAEVKGFLLEKEWIYFFTTAFKIQYPHTMLVTTTAERQFSRSEVLDIRLVDHPLNGFTWYGVVNRVAYHVVQLLNTPPFFQCAEKNDEDPQYYWLSYNPAIGKNELESVCRGPKGSSDYERDTQKALRFKKVFRLVESTD